MPGAPEWVPTLPGRPDPRERSVAGILDFRWDFGANTYCIHNGDKYFIRIGLVWKFLLSTMFIFMECL